MNPHPVSRKGKPNKATKDVRAAIAAFAQAHVEEMSDWLRAIEDPGKRLDLYLRALEYHVPKLARSEVTGESGGPIKHAVDVAFVGKPA